MLIKTNRIVLFWVIILNALAQKSPAPADIWTKKIESRINYLDKLPIELLKKSDLDTLEAWVNTLNALHLEKSLRYYPRINTLHRKFELHAEKILKNKKDLMREYAHKEYYTLLSILEEEEKLRSFSAKDLIEIINRCIEIMGDPDNELTFNEKLFFWRGMSYYETGDYYTALVNFKKVTTFKSDTAVNKPMALCYLNLRQNELARKYLTLALNHKKGDEELWYAKYILDLMENKSDEVYEDLKTLLILSPTNIRYLKLLGDYYFSRNQYAMAVEVYSKIADHNPQNSFCWLLMANCFLATNDKKNAIKTLEKAKELGNTYADVILNDIEQHIVYINNEQVPIYQTDKKNKIILLANTGLKVKIVDTTHRHMLLVQLSYVEGYTEILGYVEPKNIAISVLSINPSAIQKKTAYSIPQKSPVSKGSKSGIFYIRDQGMCYTLKKTNGSSVPINPNCP